MKIHDYGELNLQELDVMKEISSIGNSHAATALSTLLQKEIRITMPEVNVLGYDDAVERIGNAEETVTATLVRMSGDVNGLFLFLMKLEFANMITAKLLGKTFNKFSEMDALAHSALEEVGNIIICSYINAFAQLVDMDIQLSVPTSAVNMLGGILTVPMAAYGYETDKLMYFNSDFIMEHERLSDWLLMLPDIESLNHILEKLGVI